MWSSLESCSHHCFPYKRGDQCLENYCLYLGATHRSYTRRCSNIRHCAREGHLGVLSLNPEISVAQGFAVEMIFTILLVLVIFASASSDHGRKELGFVNALAIGLCVTICLMIGIPFTGAGLNPARAFGPAVVMGDFVSYHWIYWIGPIAGGIVAAISYRFVLSVEPNHTSIGEDEAQKMKSSSDATLEFKVV